MIGGKSKAGEVICARLGELGGERTQVDGMKASDSTGKVMHICKSGWWFVMIKDTDDRARVTADEEQVDLREIRLCS